MTERTGKAQTVLDLVEPDALGLTLPHEHLFVDLTCMFEPPSEASDRSRAYGPLTLENLGWIRTHYFRHYDNLCLADEGTALSEVNLFKAAGGSTIVEVTTPGIGRDPLALARLSRASGVNIIMATGFYVGPTHPAEVAGMSDADVAQRMIEEIREGVVLTPAVGDHDGGPVPLRTGIKAGIIKVGCSYPLDARDRKVLAGAAAAQRATGAALTVHVGRDERSAVEILDTLRDLDADLTRTSMDHLDLRVEKREELFRIAETGCMLEFDTFGHESSYYPLTPRDMPSDAQRLDVIGDLVHNGIGDQILVSHDICTRHRLVRYGGHGYGLIVGHILLRMRDRGWSEENIERVLVANPARLLTFTGEQ